MEITKLFFDVRNKFIEYRALERKISIALNSIEYLSAKKVPIGLVRDKVIYLSRENSLSFEDWYCIKSRLEQCASKRYKNIMKRVCELLSDWKFPENTVIYFRPQYIMNPFLYNDYVDAKLLHVEFIDSVIVFTLQILSNTYEITVYMDQVDKLEFIVNQLNEENKALCIKKLNNINENMNKIIEHNSAIAKEIEGIIKMTKIIMDDD